MPDQAFPVNPIDPINHAAALSSTILAYERAKENKVALDAAAKEAAAEAARLEQEVITLMLDHEEQTGADGLTVTVNARRYSVVQKNYWNIPAAARDEAFPALRDLGLGYLIQERVDDRSLTNVINEIAEADGALPDEYEQLHLSRYTKTTLSSRKASS